MVHRQPKLPYPSDLIVEICISESAFKVEPKANFEQVMKDTLDEREYIIIHDRFENRLTFKAIGEKHGVGAERAKQITEHALRKLRRPYARKQILGV